MLLCRRPTAIFFRSFATSSEIASILSKTFPEEDPRTIRDFKLRKMVANIVDRTGPSETVDVDKVHEKWKNIYNAKLHDTAYEEAADAGEQCDGELHSWRNERLKVEKDRNHQVPSVSAHEAITSHKRSEGGISGDKK